MSANTTSKKLNIAISRSLSIICCEVVTPILPLLVSVLLVVVVMFTVLVFALEPLFESVVVAP